MNNSNSEIKNEIKDLSDILDNVKIAHIKGKINNSFEISGYIPFSSDEKFSRFKQRLNKKFSVLGVNYVIVSEYKDDSTMEENKIGDMDTIEINLFSE